MGMTSNVKHNPTTACHAYFVPEQHSTLTMSGYWGEGEREVGGLGGDNVWLLKKVTMCGC